ncbi:hypothetical protein EVAR_82550_1 [Eumeta japonica]|uniref:Uncharacterized protein n=1 Tax=Eumeta variegata TaxID=151549 RepID=A0A4C1UWJ5_EUMVA|nr:hypothetical protein EVAR_82550_1 [Eumeta japonica]
MIDKAFSEFRNTKSEMRGKRPCTTSEHPRRAAPERNARERTRTKTGRARPPAAKFRAGANPTEKLISHIEHVSLVKAIKNNKF